MTDHDIAKKWLDYAEGDLEAAEILAEHPRSDRSWQLVVLHCHEAMEKLLKTILVQQAKEVKKIHDLIRLLDLTEIELPEEMVEYLKSLDPHYQIPKYPDLPSLSRSFHYDKDVAFSHIQQTKELFLWIKQHQLT